jgi:DNA-binding NarL/FixJ family response regulator
MTAFPAHEDDCPCWVDNPARLTLRERQVVKRLAEGQTVGEVALELGLCDKTIEYHSLRARRKIGCPSIARMTRYAIRCGLSPLENDEPMRGENGTNLK